MSKTLIEAAMISNNEIEAKTQPENEPTWLFLIKFFVGGYLIVGTIVWYIVGFFAAWGAADGDKTLKGVILEELNKNEPIIVWWAIHSAILVTIFVVLFTVLMVKFLRRKNSNKNTEV